MAYKEIGNPSKYRAHYNTKIRAIYTPLSCNVHIEQPVGARITVIYNGKNYTSDFSVPKGQSIVIKIILNEGYLRNNLLVNKESIEPNTEYVVNEDINITAELSVISFLVTAKTTEDYGLIINSSDMVSLNPAPKNQISETSFYVTYGEEIDITINPIESHKLNNILIYENNNKTPVKYTSNTIKYVVKKSITVEADCELKKFWVGISQPIETHNDYKTTWVIRNGEMLHYGFYANWGETIQFYAEQSAMTDYLGDTPNILYDLSYISIVNNDDNTKKNYNSGASITVKNNITINPIYKIHMCSISLIKDQHANISAKYGEFNYTDIDFKVPYGSNVSFFVTIKDPESYYLNDLVMNGKSIIQNTNYRITEDIIIAVDVRDAINVTYHSIKINQPDNARIYVIYNNKLHTDSFPAIEGTICTTYIVPNDGYSVTQFKINDTDIPINERHQFTVDKDYTLSATTQTSDLNINFNQVTGGFLYIIHNNTQKTSSFTCTYGDTITIIRIANYGYVAGTLYDNGKAIENYSTITVTEDHTITTSFAIQTFTVTVTQPTNGRITINGTYGSSFTFNYGSMMTIQCTPNDGYRVLKLYDNGYSYDYNSITFSVTENHTISATIIIDKTSTIIAYGTKPWYNTKTNYKYYFPDASKVLDVTTIDGGAKLNVSSITNAKRMFYECYNLTSLDFSNFDTSNIYNMNSMFYYCNSLTSLDLSNFDTSNVTEMCNMFLDCTSLTSLNVSNFDTSNVTNISGMFDGCGHLTSLNVSNFDTSNVVDMSYMFDGCDRFTSLNVSNFDTSKVTTMRAMFGCSSLTSLDLSNFDTSKVTNMQTMFSDCSSLTSLDLSNFDTSNVTDISGMFFDCESLKSVNLSSFDTSKVTTMYFMFFSCKSLTSLDLSNFDTSNVTDMSNMFKYCTSLISLDLSNFDTSKVTTMYRMFYECRSLKSVNLSNFNNSNVTDMSNMFYNCYSLTSLDFSSFNTSKVTTMEYMFAFCSSLTSLDLSNFDTSKVISMEYIFYYCTKLTSVNLSSFDTSNVLNMEYMFDTCTSLTSLNVSNFNTSNVLRMYCMFADCRSLTSLDLSNFDTSKVSAMGFMFSNCTSLTSLDLSNFDTSNVYSMSRMFYNCSSLTSLNLSNFDTSNVEEMDNMFRYCTKLETLDYSLVGFTTNNLAPNLSYCTSLSTLRIHGTNDSTIVDNFITAAKPPSICVVTVVN